MANSDGWVLAGFFKVDLAQKNPLSFFWVRPTCANPGQYSEWVGWVEFLNTFPTKYHMLYYLQCTATIEGEGF